MAGVPTTAWRQLGVGPPRGRFDLADLVVLAGDASGPQPSGQQTQVRPDERAADVEEDGFEVARECRLVGHWRVLAYRGPAYRCTPRPITSCVSRGRPPDSSTPPGPCAPSWTAGRCIRGIVTTSSSSSTRSPPTSSITAARPGDVEAAIRFGDETTLTLRGRRRRLRSARPAGPAGGDAALGAAHRRPRAGHRAGPVHAVRLRADAGAAESADAEHSGRRARRRSDRRDAGPRRRAASGRSCATAWTARRACRSSPTRGRRRGSRRRSGCWPAPTGPTASAVRARPPRDS